MTAGTRLQSDPIGKAATVAANPAEIGNRPSPFAPSTPNHEDIIMKKTIQLIGIATVIAAMTTVTQAQTSTSGDKRGGTNRGSTDTSQSSPYNGECVPDVSGNSGQSGTGQKSGKNKNKDKDKGERGASGSAGSSSGGCPPGTVRAGSSRSGQGSGTPGASSPETGAGTSGSGSRSGTSTTPDGSSRDSHRNSSGGNTGSGSSGSKSGTNR